MASEDLAIKWNDIVARGFVDIFPSDLFEKEGVTEQLDHTVLDPANFIERARCKLIVENRSAELDYRAFAPQNRKWGMELGVLRLFFRDKSRKAIAKIEWKYKYADRFEGAKAKVVVPPLTAVAPYRKGKKSIKKTFRAVTDRPEQVKFRRDLMIAYGGKCCVTGCSVKTVLEGAHIDPYYGPASNHRQNGLLLRLDLHELLDQGEMAVEPDTMKVHFTKVALAWGEYAALHGKAKLAPPTNGGVWSRPSPAALRARWKDFQSKA